MPPLLLFGSLGLALAFASPRTRVPALGLAAVGALAVAQISFPESWREGLFLACWVTVAGAAASVHLPNRVCRQIALPMALWVGIIAGAVTAIAGHTRDVLTGLPALAVLAPAAWLVATGRQIAIKVVTSWLIAIAVLAAALPLTPTPGYVPDHMQ